ncbi:hypothetical protein N784_05785 [Pontibacillus litoralis JSM 072002]|uniref:Uncharacterized protein n=1 Tax=Pontibacillus litoralis JSM 072002 TaxID=1385512 RepID=A0A0A5FZ09_9BACI|nr:hypothetical protein N784_05785 [Pontibacillus litoralis JSM 072002]
MKNKLVKILLLFKFDLKNTGVIWFFPLVMWVISVIYLILQVPIDQSSIYNSIIMFQGFYVPFIGFGIMFRLKELYEDGASESLMPYYTLNLPLDIVRYLLLHFFGVIIWCLVFSIKYDINLIWPINIIHFFLLSILFIFFSTTLIITIKHIEFSLTVLLTYVVIEMATLGEFMPWPHVFIFDQVSLYPELRLKFVFICFYIICLVCATGILIKRDSTKKTNSI